MTLSTPLKIVGLAALALALGMGGLVLMLGHHSPSAAAAPPVAAPPHTFHVAPVKAAPKPHRAPVKLDAGLPLFARAILERKPVFVMGVYNSHVPGDRAVLVEARAGAHAAHVPFVAVDVAHPVIAEAVATWSNSAADPVTYVVRRPGRAVFMVAGRTDRITVAQAALTAR